MGGFAYNPRLRRLAGLPPLGGVPSFTNEDLDLYGENRRAEEGDPFSGGGPDRPKIEQSTATAAVGVPASGSQALKSELAGTESGPAFFDIPGLVKAAPGMLASAGMDLGGSIMRGVGRATGQLPPSPSIDEAATASRAPATSPRGPIPHEPVRSSSGAPRAATGSIEQAAAAADGHGAPGSFATSGALGESGIPWRGGTDAERAASEADSRRAVRPGSLSFSWGRDVEIDPETGRPAEDSMLYDRSTQGFVQGHESRGGSGFFQPNEEDVAFLPDSVLEEAGMRRQLGELRAPPGQLTPEQQRQVAFATAKERGIRGAASDIAQAAEQARRADFSGALRREQEDLDTALQALQHSSLPEAEKKSRRRKASKRYSRAVNDLALQFGMVKPKLDLNEIDDVESD